LTRHSSGNGGIDALGELRQLLGALSSIEGGWGVEEGGGRGRQREGEGDCGRGSVGFSCVDTLSLSRELALLASYLSEWLCFAKRRYPLTPTFTPIYLARLRLPRGQVNIPVPCVLVPHILTVTVAK